MFRPKVGYCHCGCGQKTEVWSRSDTAKGRVKGKFKKYIFRHKNPPSFKGKKRSLSDRIKKSIAAKKRVADGRHNFYLGGISTKWMVIRNSFEYKEWHRSVLERDRFTCVLCGLKGGWHASTHSRVELHADHIKPKAIYPNELFNINNGRTLCKECHLKTETWGGRTTYAKQQIYSR
jgi:hypothetical protein